MAFCLRIEWAPPQFSPRPSSLAPPAAPVTRGQAAALNSRRSPAARGGSDRTRGDRLWLPLAFGCAVQARLRLRGTARFAAVPVWALRRTIQANLSGVARSAAQSKDARPWTLGPSRVRVRPSPRHPEGGRSVAAQTELPKDLPRLRGMPPAPLPLPPRCRFGEPRCKSGAARCASEATPCKSQAASCKAGARL